MQILDTEMTVLSDTVEIPGLGFLPVNNFVVHAEQPPVVDTGLEPRTRSSATFSPR